MVAHIRQMAVEKKQWLADASFRSGVALCQMIPGATAMQAAAYVGFRTRGVGGAAAAFTAFGLPAFLIMTALSVAYVHVQGLNLPAIVSAFSGLQVIVIAIVANAALSFGRTWLKGWRSFFIAALAAVLFIIGINPVLVVLMAAVCGLALHEPNASPLAPAVAAEESHSRTPVAWVISAAVALLVLLFLLRREYFDLALLMARIDLFAFGGGFASLPLMFNEVVHVRGWVDGLTFLNGIALGQMTPGPIVITATFIGYLRYGLLGGLFATIFIFLPSFLLVVATVPYYDKFRTSPFFNRALQGILYSFVGLLVSVTIRFAWDIPWDIVRIVLTGGAFAALFLKVALYGVIAAGLVISILFL